jgi:hypothetical protein
MSDPTTYGGVPIRGLTLEKLARKTLANTYHARNYGVKGDGTTDDITALQDLVDLIDEGGDPAALVMGSGVFYITQELELRADNLHLVLDGATILGPSAGTSDGGLLVVVDRVTTTRVMDGVIITGGLVKPQNASDNAVAVVSGHNVRVIGVNADLTTGQRGFVIENITPAPVALPLDDVRLIGCGSFGGGVTGIHVGNTDDDAIRNVVISGHVIDSATTGITVNTGSASKYINRVTLSGITILGPTTGINFSRVKNGTIQGVVIRDVSTTGLTMAAQAEDCVVNGLTVIGTGTPGSAINIASSSVRNILSNLLIDGSFTHGIAMNAADNTVTSATIRSATTGITTYADTNYSVFSDIVFDSCTTDVSSYRTGDKYSGLVDRTGSATDVLRDDASTIIVDSPTALASGNTNDYALPSVHGNLLLRISANASGSTLTGIAGGYEGRTVRIVCVANYLTLAHQDANSSTSNRIVSHTGNNITLFTSDSALLVYDSSSTRWRVLDFLTDTIYATHMTWAAGQYIDMTNTGADEAIIRCEATGDTVTADPTTDAPDGWLEFYIGGATRYVPYYTIDGA